MQVRYHAPVLTNYFGRYANPLITNDLFYVVRISTGAPKFALDYRIDSEFPAVYPVGIFGRGYSKEIFRDLYRRLLDQNEDEIKFCLKIFTEFAKAGQKDLLFLCFENLASDETAFCHRQFLAEWLEEKGLGVCREIFDKG